MPARTPPSGRHSPRPPRDDSRQRTREIQTEAAQEEPGNQQRDRLTEGHPPGMQGMYYLG